MHTDAFFSVVPELQMAFAVHSLCRLKRDRRWDEAKIQGALFWLKTCKASWLPSCSRPGHQLTPNQALRSLVKILSHEWNDLGLQNPLDFSVFYSLLLSGTRR